MLIKEGQVWITFHSDRVTPFFGVILVSETSAYDYWPHYINNRVLASPYKRRSIEIHMNDLGQFSVMWGDVRA